VTRVVALSIDSAAVDEAEPFQQEHISRLGLRGISRWKHLGWRHSPE
jgi:hypothetical protein